MTAATFQMILTIIILISLVTKISLAQ